MSSTPNDDIRQQPAIQKLLERMPAQVQDSFTETQLSYLHIALGAREWGKHQLDVRGDLIRQHWTRH
ncbi:MAG: hypothetical protein E6Q75_02640 [Rheinheimera sp.]|nr:MAG: hypothetical protein E6Q75_02640 [Rheinheimera sp.]